MHGVEPSENSVNIHYSLYFDHVTILLLTGRGLVDGG